MHKFNYDVSIIIPVYNAEDYLSECVESILKQKYDISKIEILLIDDGSTDNSLKICKNYKKKYNNIVLIEQPNSGVSKARNSGISKATGKYIMLLDSDDTLSNNAVKNLFNFFEEHYNDVDIVTYPIMFNRHGKISKNIRYNAYDKGTGVYDVNEYIYLNQSTVNIMIKNEFENNNLYNEKMKLSEDQNFDTEMIMKKEKIGYVQDAIYYYRKYDASVSASRNNPYYCFNDIMSYNELLLEKYKKGNIIPKYIQSLVINTIKWRIRTDELFPYYLESTEFDNAINRIKNIIKKIDVDVIMNVSDMNIYHKLYLLKFADHKIKVKIENEINIYCDDNLIIKFDTIDGIISRFKIKENKLQLLGSLLNPLFDYEKPNLYLKKVYSDGSIQEEKLDLKISNNSYYQAYFKVTSSYQFDTQIDISDLKLFQLYIKVKNKKLNIIFTFDKFAPNNFISGNVNALYSKKEHCFKLRKNTISNFFKSRIANFKRCLSKNKRACVYRLMHYVYKTRKNIWLYTDSDNELDNAYEQFIHDFNINDGINRYYVANLNEEKINTKFTKLQKRRIIKRGSLKHKMLYINSQKIITSFIDLQIYCPFNTSISCYNDLTNYDLIYLQHGVLHADLRKMLSKEFTEIDKLVVSSNFEKENLVNKYNYNLDDLILSGMPRMKQIVETSPKNKILFAPSWRKYLIGNLVNNKRKPKKRDFINSNFYKEIYEFLHSEGLNEILKQNKLVLDFKLHPIFNQYKNLFKIENNKYININSNDLNISEYKIFITDFSSYQFDFIRFERPIIYFLPDKREIKAGLHSYRNIDLKYEKSFGNLCLTSKDVIEELKKIIKNNCEADKKYKDRMANFLFNYDNSCDIIYDYLKKQ